MSLHLQPVDAITDMPQNNGSLSGSLPEYIGWRWNVEEQV